MQVSDTRQPGKRFRLRAKISLLQIDSGLALAAQIIDMAETELRQHSYNVSQLAFRLAVAVKLPEEECRLVALGGLLHDIGKLCIQRSILTKPGRLTPSEYEQVRQHSIIGANYLHNLGVPKVVYEIARYHHEQLDGKGYPYGLEGELIPISVRIVSLCDAYDAMNSHRSYRAPLTTSQILSELKKGAGTQFDADLVATFLKVVLENSPR